MLFIKGTATMLDCCCACNNIHCVDAVSLFAVPVSLSFPEYINLNPNKNSINQFSATCFISFNCFRMQNLDADPISAAKPFNKLNNNAANRCCIRTMMFFNLEKLNMFMSINADLVS